MDLCWWVFVLSSRIILCSTESVPHTLWDNGAIHCGMWRALHFCFRVLPMCSTREWHLDIGIFPENFCHVDKCSLCGIDDRVFSQRIPAEGIIQSQRSKWFVFPAADHAWLRRVDPLSDGKRKTICLDLHRIDTIPAWLLDSLAQMHTSSQLIRMIGAMIWDWLVDWLTSDWVSDSVRFS